MSIQLGQRVRDTVSGFEGVVVCRAEWLNGCIRFSVQARVDKDGKLPELQWIDEPQCEALEDPPATNPIRQPQRMGGPRNDPARSF